VRYTEAVKKETVGYRVPRARIPREVDREGTLCHGIQAWRPDFSGTSRVLAFLLCGRHALSGHEPDDYLYAVMNMHWESHSFELPAPPHGLRWHVFSNTGAPPPEDVWEPGQERPCRIRKVS
jgi:pullulanase/glycogen debranching enzyme